MSALHHLAIGIGAAGPSLAGVMCTAKDAGRTGVRRLFASLVRWRLAARWYALCLVGPLAVALTAVALHRLAVGDDAKFHLETATLVLTPPFLVVGLLVGPLQGELGWRGYALPCLIDRLSSVPWRREEDRRGRVVPLAMPSVPRVKRLVRRALAYACGLPD